MSEHTPWLLLALRGSVHAYHIARAALPWLALLAVLVSVRLAYLLFFGTGDGLRSAGKKRRRDRDTCHVAVFLGSGGHTTEMLQLLQSLPATQYTPRTYVTASGDKFSMVKALQWEEAIAEKLSGEKPVDAGAAKSQQFSFVTIPRARNVHQAWLSTPLSVLLAFFECFRQIVLLPILSKKGRRQQENASHKFADLILMNGPGTCVPIVAAVYTLRIVGLPSPRLMYIESFARVRSLSLTAKILRFFVDKFVVQWNEAVVRKAYFHGWLV